MTHDSYRQTFNVWFCSVNTINVDYAATISSLFECGLIFVQCEQTLTNELGAYEYCIDYHVLS